MASPARKRVAVVGSGMAGLVTAYLLNRDHRQRYDVTLFESGEKLSLDSASISIPTPQETQSERIDLPMRAFAGGFYRNLCAMYDYLGVEYRPQRFLFTFANIAKTAPGDNVTAPYTPYFAHASNNHQIPPPRPRGLPIISHLPPRAGDSVESMETLGQYLRRTGIPKYFQTQYLLPLMSSVATCTHENLLSFPASDVVTYKRTTHNAQHYTVTSGVSHVQGKLSKLIDTRLCSFVLDVQPQESGSKVLWKQMGELYNQEAREEHFDLVILAVTPDVVGKIFKPLTAPMAQIPTAMVESVVHSDNSIVHDLSLMQTQPSSGGTKYSRHMQAQNIVLVSTSEDSRSTTESVHVQPSGLVVTTCPVSPIDPSCVIQSSKFTRVLRSRRSRQIVNDIFGTSSNTADYEKPLKRSTEWRNGDSGVYLTGGWCWDGMVLLEGCVVSAMRVANALDVEVPWRNHH